MGTQEDYQNHIALNFDIPIPHQKSSRLIHNQYHYHSCSNYLKQKMKMKDHYYAFFFYPLFFQQWETQNHHQQMNAHWMSYPGYYFGFIATFLLDGVSYYFNLRVLTLGR